MAKRCVEEFNPWPPFVDIFSSVILVLLLFLLITIVNIGYYAQFKFKVSYTGTIASDEMILKGNTAKFNIDKIQIEEEKAEIKVKDIIKPKDIKAKENNGDIENAGKDLSKIYEDEITKQSILLEGDYLILNFGSSSIKLDNLVIKQVKDFIKSMKQKYSKHIVKITAVDPRNQISATVMKQISLARTLNARNLIRKLNYDIKDVRVDLLKAYKLNIQNQNEDGYLIIRVEKK